MDGILFSARIALCTVYLPSEAVRRFTYLNDWCLVLAIRHCLNPTISKLLGYRTKVWCFSQREVSPKLTLNLLCHFRGIVLDARMLATFMLWPMELKSFMTLMMTTCSSSVSMVPPLIQTFGLTNIQIFKSHLQSEQQKGTIYFSIPVQA